MSKAPSQEQPDEATVEEAPIDEQGPSDPPNGEYSG